VLGKPKTGSLNRLAGVDRPCRGAAPRGPRAIAADEEPSLLGAIRHLAKARAPPEPRFHPSRLLRGHPLSRAGKRSLVYWRPNECTQRQADSGRLRPEAARRGARGPNWAAHRRFASPAQPVAGGDANEELARLRLAHAHFSKAVRRISKGPLSARRRAGGCGRTPHG